VQEIMKRVLTIVIVIDVLCCGWILIEEPFIKLPTEQALNAIERRFLRDDLSGEATHDLDNFTDIIVGNQKGTQNSLTYVRIGGISIGALLLVQNIILLVKLGQINKHSKSRLDNPLPRPQSELEPW
jgi:hypothetical protein